MAQEQGLDDRIALTAEKIRAGKTSLGIEFGSTRIKAVLIDDRMSIVGSYNMDMRSTYQDTELMLAVDSPELNAVIRKEAEVNKTYSRYMTPEGTYINGENYVPREMSAGKKIFYGVLRVLIMPFRRFL